MSGVVRKFTATFLGAERLANSPSGNPVWRVQTSAGNYTTDPDSQVGHEVGDYAETLVGRRATFRRRDGQGLIIGIAPERPHTCT